MMNLHPLHAHIQPVDILAIGVHPDDVELSCSGTLLSHLDKGYSVGLLDLTLGELGTRGNAELRSAEARLAAEQMGASFRAQLTMRDGFFGDSEDEIRAIIQVVRAAKPRIVLANALSDRHPDHGRAAKVIADACFYAGLLKIKTVDPDGVPQERWRPSSVMHYVQDHQLVPDFVVDISPYMEKKMELIRCFDSQFFKSDSKEPETPISVADFLDFIRAKAKVYGRPCGFEYAEAFQVQQYPGIKDLFASFHL